jgi:hypothetical protein
MFDTNLTRRPKAPPIWVRALPIVGLVALVAIAIGVLAVKGERAETRHRIGEAKNEQVALAQMKSTFDDLSASKAGARVDTRVQATGEAGEIEGAVKQLAATVAAERDSYHAEITALGFPGFLAPQQLATENLGEVHAKLVRAKAVEEKYRALSDGLNVQFEGWVNKTSLSPDHKAQLVANFNQGWASGAPVRDQVWNDEASLIGQYDGLVVMLSRDRGAWRLQGGHKLAFTSPSVLSAYNSYIMNIRTLAADQAQLRQEKVRSTDNQFQDLIGQVN